MHSSISITYLDSMSSILFYLFIPRNNRSKIQYVLFFKILVSYLIALLYDPIFLNLHYIYCIIDIIKQKPHNFSVCLYNSSLAIIHSPVSSNTRTMSSVNNIDHVIVYWTCLTSLGLRFGGSWDPNNRGYRIGSYC